MIQSRFTITTHSTPEIESLIASFERDRHERQVDLSDYLPSPKDPAYAAVVTELSRIDLEISHNQGREPDAVRFLEAFPVVFQDDENRSQLFFEEYRLRSWSGEQVDREEYTDRYGIDTSRWPKFPPRAIPKVLSTRITKRFAGVDLIIPEIRYPRVGDTFAGYPLMDRLGEGAFSRVFLARQPDLASREVVLKVTPLGTEESDRLARLQHSSIIPVYSIHRDGELSCICMPFLGATTLADLSPLGQRWASLDGPASELVSTILDRRRSTVVVTAEPQREAGLPNRFNRETDYPAATTRPELGTAQADRNSAGVEGLSHLMTLGYAEALLALVTGAVEGLAHAHGRGIIHRDLKPANILVSDEGTPILLDFNLAVASQEAKTRIVGGTLPYMSPQQLASLENANDADASDDVFSIGVILYELLTGRLPFACPGAGEPFDLAELIDSRCSQPASIRTLNRNVTPGLEAIIECCLAADRSDRYRDANELLEDLKCHQQHRLLRHAPNRSLGERISKWVARHPRVSSASSMASLATLLLLLCGLLIQSRTARIAEMTAEANRGKLRTAIPNLVAALSTPGREEEILDAGLTNASKLLNEWLIPDGASERPSIRWIDAGTAEDVRRQLGQLTFLMADAEADLALLRAGPDASPPSRQARAQHWNRLTSSLVPEWSKRANAQQQRLDARLRGLPINSLPVDQTDPESGDLQSIATIRAGDAARLLALSKAQIQREPTNVTSWFFAAIANARLGRWEASLSALDVCDSMAPQSLAILFNRGLCQLELGNAAAARDDFSACLALQPSMMAARFNRALAEQRQGNLEAALADLDQLVATGRASTRMLLLRAQVHDALGNDREALADRQAAMSVPPRDANDWVSRGVMLLADSPESALQDFLTAIRIAPEDYHALQNTAHVYAERLNSPQQALIRLDQLVDAWPKDASAVASRGILRARLGETEQAVADAQSAAMLNPGAREQLQIAGIYALIGDDLEQDVRAASRSSQTQTSQTQTPQAMKSLALKWLAEALRSDASLAHIAEQDPDLRGVSADPTFQRLIESAAALELRH